MKSLKECLVNEIKTFGIWNQLRDKSFSVYISEKNFTKLSKNKKVTMPLPNKSIKIIDNNKDIRFDVVPNGSIAIIEKMKDDDKNWYLRGGDAQKYENQSVFVIKLYSSNEKTALLKDTIGFPTFELLNYFGFKSNYGVPENSIGMLNISGNLGSYAHAFTAESMDKIKQVLNFIGFKIVEK